MDTLIDLVRLGAPKRGLDKIDNSRLVEVSLRSHKLSRLMYSLS